MSDEIQIGVDIIKGTWDGNTFVITEARLNEVSLVRIPDEMTIEEARRKFGVNPFTWMDDGE